MKAVVAAFNQEKALEGAFSVITNLRMDLFEALVCILSNNQIFHIGDRGRDENSGPKNSFSRPRCRGPAGARAPPHGEKTQN